MSWKFSKTREVGFETEKSSFIIGFFWYNKKYVKQKLVEKLLKKLNYKDQEVVYMVNVPEEIQEFVAFVGTRASVKQSIKSNEEVLFGLFFVQKQEEIENIVKELEGNETQDPTLWFCYPKKSSKKYTCEFNRDTGWESLGNAGFEPVRQVALNDNWSALRFRKVENISTITRRKSYALTDEAKKRTTNQK